GMGHLRPSASMLATGAAPGGITSGSDAADAADAARAASVTGDTSGSCRKSAITGAPRKPTEPGDHGARARGRLDAAAGPASGCAGSWGGGGAAAPRGA